MPRRRETILTEWDAVRAGIAAGCTHSGPRDWFEGVLDEQDHIIADLVREVARLRYYEDAFTKQRNWTDDAKRAAGYHVNVSFDDVWAEALAAVIEKRGEKPAK